MKTQMIEKGGKYFLRKMLFGFIPLYFSWDGGWWISRCEMSKSNAEMLIDRWQRHATERKTFNESEIKIVKEINT